ncbi:MAG: hypothetical protein ACRD2E_00020 [Terriglobales bacterium]
MPCARKDAIVMGNVIHAVASSIVLRRRGHRRLALYLQASAAGLLILAYPRRSRRALRKWPRSIAKAGRAIGQGLASAGRAIAREAA